MSGPEAALAFFLLGGGFWVVRPLAAAIAKRIAGEHRPAAQDPQGREAVLEELQQLRQEVTELQGVAFLSVVTIIGAFGLLFPVVRALAERLRPRQDSGVSAELQAMREEVAQELQQVRHEMAELGERLDFAERLLAKQRDAERLAPPT